jgi:hypothetical protein
MPTNTESIREYVQLAALRDLGQVTDARLRVPTQH